jgi:hypothetical protein
MFPTSVRYTGVSISFQVAAILSGFFPLAAGSLLMLGDQSPVWVCVVLVAIASVSTAMVFKLSESKGISLGRLDEKVV